MLKSLLLQQVEERDNTLSPTNKIEKAGVSTRVENGHGTDEVSHTQLNSNTGASEELWPAVKANVTDPFGNSGWSTDTNNARLLKEMDFIATFRSCDNNNIIDWLNDVIRYVRVTCINPQNARTRLMTGPNMLDKVDKETLRMLQDVKAPGFGKDALNMLYIWRLCKQEPHTRATVL